MKRIHIAAMHHPLPLIRANSYMVKGTYAEYDIYTDFGDGKGYRCVFFGDKDSMLSTLSEGGRVQEVDEKYVIVQPY